MIVARSVLTPVCSHTLLEYMYVAQAVWLGSSYEIDGRGFSHGEIHAMLLLKVR